MSQSAEKDVPRDLDVEVIGGTYPEAYLYVGSGDDCVLLCDRNAPKWRNAVGLTPDNARKLAAALVRMADQSERPIPPGGTDPNNPIIHRPGCSWETTPYCNCGADRERLAPGGRRV